MVSFIPLNITDEDSVEYVLSTIDNAIQYGEDLEPKVKRKTSCYTVSLFLMCMISRNPMIWSIMILNSSSIRVVESL